MRGARNLCRRDYERALGFVAEAASLDESEPFTTPVVEALLHLIPADDAGYYEYTERQTHPGENTFYARTGGVADINWSRPEVQATMGSWPLLDARVKNTSRPLRLSDFLTSGDLRRNPWYQEVHRPRGVIEEMKGWIPGPLGITRAFYFVRTSRPTFTERDRALLAVLLEHLSSIRERWGRRHRPEVLTARESQVLALAAVGLTNAEIATELFLSRSTVRTHLEHVYEKLGVRSRTAAVSWLRTRH